MPEVQLAFEFVRKGSPNCYISRSQNVFSQPTVDAILHGRHLHCLSLCDPALPQFHPDRDLG